MSERDIIKLRLMNCIFWIVVLLGVLIVNLVSSR